jgi:hypothetical protein
MRAGGRFRRGGRPEPEPEPNPAEPGEPAVAGESGEPAGPVERAEATEVTAPEVMPAEGTAKPEPLEGERGPDGGGTQRSRSGRRRRAAPREDAPEEDVELLVSFPLEEPPAPVPVIEEDAGAGSTGTDAESGPDTSEGFFGSAETGAPAEELLPPVVAAERAVRAGPGQPDPVRFARLHLRTGSLIRARSEYEALAADDQLDLEGTLDLAEVRWRTADAAGAGLAAAAYVAAGGMDTLGFLIAAEAAAREERIIDARDFAVRASAMGLDNLDALFAGLPRRMDWPRDMWGLPSPPAPPRPHGRLRVDVVEAEVRVVEAAPAEAAAIEEASAEAAPAGATAEAAAIEEAQGAAPTPASLVEPPAGEDEGQVEQEARVAEVETPPGQLAEVETPEPSLAQVETPEMAAPGEAARLEPPKETVRQTEAAPTEPAPAEPVPAEGSGLFTPDTLPSEAATEANPNEGTPEQAPAMAEPETWWTAAQPRSEDLATESRPSEPTIPEPPSPGPQQSGSVDAVEPAARLDLEPGSEIQTQAAAAEQSPLDAEIAAGRESLASGDALVAALHLAVALRISPAAAPTVLEVIGGHDEVALELVRGDALRLLGEEVAQPASLLGGTAQPDEPPDSESGSSAGPSDPDHPLRWE